jgi:hypothetical protein
LQALQSAEFRARLQAFTAKTMAKRAGA